MCFALLILILTACGSSPDQLRGTETAIAATVVAQITARAHIPTSTRAATSTAQPTPTFLPTHTATPTSTSTPQPTETPLPSATPAPTSTPDPLFVSFDSLCKYVKTLSDIEVKAFSQRTKGRSVGPWRGRVSNYIEGGYGVNMAEFIMNSPDFKSTGYSPNDNSVNFITNKTFLINEVYDIYGAMDTVFGGRGSSVCHMVLKYDSSETRISIVK
jgi:hypothetical protein